MVFRNAQTIRTALLAGELEGYPVHSVYYFTDTQTGEVKYALFTDPSYDDIQGHDTPFCCGVTTLMVNGMLTIAGEKWLDYNP